MQAHLAMLSDETVAVVDHSNVHLHHAKTLKKVRTLKPTDYPIVGLASLPKKRTVAVSSDGQLVSYARSEGWRQESITPIQFPADKGGLSSKGASRKGKSANQFTIQSAHAFFQEGANMGDDAASTTSTGTGSDSKLGLYLAILTVQGSIFRVDIRTGVASLIAEVHAGALEDSTSAVGLWTGLLAFAQSGSKTVQYISMLKGLEQLQLQQQQRGSGKAGQLRTVQTQIGIQSIAVHPTEEGCLAVGGVRGELAIYRGDGLSSGRHFADHWHHTPLAALHFTPDGSTLLSAAAESVILSWSLQTYTYTKLVSCSVGGIHSMSGDPWAGAKVLITAAESALALVHLVQRRVEQTVTGVHWSNKHQCQGIVQSTWRGQPSIVLTGLPEVVRFYDPLQQQTMHSIHVSHNMEATVAPPSSGIHHVALWDHSKTVATYEAFSSSAIPTALRWWVYEEKRKRHVERQCILQPHSSDILALRSFEGAEKEGRPATMFSLSGEQVKCWAPKRKVGEMEEDGASDDDAEDETEELKHSFTKFHGVSTWSPSTVSAATTSTATTMELSKDGALLFVATDCVTALSVREAHKIGSSWPALFTFVQMSTPHPLRFLCLSEDKATVLGCNCSEGFVWSCHTGEVVKTFAPVAKQNSLLAVTGTVDGNFVVTEGTRDTTEEATAGAGNGHAQLLDSNGAVLGSTQTPMPIRHLSLLSSQSATHFGLVAVSVTRGLEVLNVDFAASKVTEDDQSARQLTNGTLGDAAHKQMPSLQQLFPSGAPKAMNGNAPGLKATGAATTAEQGNDKLLEVRGQREATNLLTQVLHSEAYAAPPMSALLDSFMGKLRQGQ